jgi:hypothetical protein
VDGILYSATGERYLAEALVSARSSMRFNRVPHVIFTDREIGGLGPDEEKLLSVETYEPGDNPFAEKIRNMIRTPFERSIFLDSDTYVVGDITHVLELLDKFDLAAAFAPGYRRMRDPEVPAAFYEFNTGVIAWRTNARTAAFLEDWRDTYDRLNEERPFAPMLHASGYEQPAFRRCAWRHDVRVCVLGPEYNYRPKKPGTLVGRVLVIHGRSIDHEAVAAFLNRDPRKPRSFDSLSAGFRPGGPD